MEKSYSDQMHKLLNEFTSGITLSDTDMLDVLNGYYRVDLVDATSVKLPNGSVDILEAFIRDFILVEESEIDAARDNYWCVFRHKETGTCYRQTSHYSSYTYDPQYSLSIWTHVRPVQVTSTSYMEC